MNIVVTGSEGFIARNLLVRLRHMENIHAVGLNRNASTETWEAELDKADVVFHLAGTNRPTDPNDFQKNNTAFSGFILDRMENTGRAYKIIFSSSTQAALDNAYGKSKKEAEDYIRTHIKHGSAFIYRLPGVFGKWARPNYNSVVATYCYNATHHLPLEVRDEQFTLRLVYVDDVIKSFIDILDSPRDSGTLEIKITPEYTITLGELANTIQSFAANRKSLFLANVGDGLEKALYSTWLSYLPEDEFSYGLELKTDPRGSLFELLKTKSSGQIFLSTTLPGITRGNHFHHTKTEKFLVIQGSGRIQFRSALNEHVIEYDVEGAKPVVVDIPPGYTHNITNTGTDTMITLFWANEVFDPQNPDTYFEKV